LRDKIANGAVIKVSNSLKKSLDKLTKEGKIQNAIAGYQSKASLKNAIA